MDFDTVSAEDFGKSLTGIGVNLLSTDVIAFADFMVKVFGAQAFRVSEDFAIVTSGGAIIQIHGDGTYGAHPLLGLVPENPPRGGGLQLYLFGIDPEQAEKRANDAGFVVIEPTAEKPHGLRECTILSPDGYAFSPAVPK